MTEKIIWVCDCYLQSLEDETKFLVRAAVSSESEYNLLELINEHTLTLGYRTLWLEERISAVNFLKQYGHDFEVDTLVAQIVQGKDIAIGELKPEFIKPAEPEKEVTFKEALLNLDYKNNPVFAVLDGAQFDNLPQALFDGDFISRSLYLDRGDNDKEQVITAPHMIWLDERKENIVGRSYKETIEALFELIDNKPAAVFWQHPEGAEALYKHLRGINMVLFPKEALDDWEEPEVEPDENGNQPEQISHTMVTFRHADANVMAQIIPTLNPLALSRLYGKATAIYFLPDAEWSENKNKWSCWIREKDLPHPPKGFLKIDNNILEKLDENSCQVSRRRIKEYLKKAAPEHTIELSEEKLDLLILNAEKVGDELGLTNEYTHGLWAFITLITGQELLNDIELIEHLKSFNADGDELIKETFKYFENTSTQELERLIWSSK